MSWKSLSTHWNLTVVSLLTSVEFINGLSSILLITTYLSKSFLITSFNNSNAVWKVIEQVRIRVVKSHSLIPFAKIILFWDDFIERNFSLNWKIVIWLLFNNHFTRLPPMSQVYWIIDGRVKVVWTISLKLILSKSSTSYLLLHKLFIFITKYTIVCYSMAIFKHLYRWYIKWLHCSALIIFLLFFLNVTKTNNISLCGSDFRRKEALFF